VPEEAHQHRQPGGLVEIVQDASQRSAAANHALHDAQRLPAPRAAAQLSSTQPATGEMRTYLPSLHAVQATPYPTLHLQQACHWQASLLSPAHTHLTRLLLGLHACGARMRRASRAMATRSIKAAFHGWPGRRCECLAARAHRILWKTRICASLREAQHSLRLLTRRRASPRAALLTVRLQRSARSGRHLHICISYDPQQPLLLSAASQRQAGL